MEDETIKEGSVFILSWGSYSDYSVRSLMRAKADITIDFINGLFNAAVNNRALPDFQIQERLAEILIEQDLAEHVPCSELNLGDGSYCEPEIKRVEKA